MNTDETEVLKGEPDEIVSEKAVREENLESLRVLLDDALQGAGRTDPLLTCDRRAQDFGCQRTRC